MAINMMCTNSRCKFYWEDNCTRNINEERIDINGDGQCNTFERGTSEWYEEAEKCENECDIETMQTATVKAMALSDALYAMADTYGFKMK